jgi:hypothetical protein
MNLSAFDRANCRAIVESHVAGATTENEMFYSLDPILRPYLVDKEQYISTIKHVLIAMYLAEKNKAP